MADKGAPPPPPEQGWKAHWQKLAPEVEKATREVHHRVAFVH